MIYCDEETFLNVSMKDVHYRKVEQCGERKREREGVHRW